MSNSTVVTTSVQRKQKNKTISNRSSSIAIIVISTTNNNMQILHTCNQLPYLAFIVLDDNQTTDACIMSTGIAKTILIKDCFTNNNINRFSIFLTVQLFCSMTRCAALMADTICDPLWNIEIRDWFKHWVHLTLIFIVMSHFLYRPKHYAALWPWPSDIKKQ